MSEKTHEVLQDAAPELLKALVNVTADLEAFCERNPEVLADDGTPLPHPFRWAVLPKLHRAIAKATTQRGPDDDPPMSSV